MTAVDSQRAEVWTARWVDRTAPQRAERFTFA